MTPDEAWHDATLQAAIDACTVPDGPSAPPAGCLRVTAEDGTEILVPLDRERYAHFDLHEGVVPEDSVSRRRTPRYYLESAENFLIEARASSDPEEHQRLLELCEAYRMLAYTAHHCRKHKRRG